MTGTLGVLQANYPPLLAVTVVWHGIVVQVVVVVVVVPATAVLLAEDTVQDGVRVLSLGTGTIAVCLHLVKSQLL